MRGPTRRQQHGEQTAVDHDRRGDRQQRLAPAPPVGKSAGDRDRRGEEQHRDQLHLQEVDVVEAEAGAVGWAFAGAETQRPGGDDIEDCVGGQHDECAQDQLTPVVAEHLCRRCFDPLPVFDSTGEHRRLGQLQPHIQPDRHHHGANQERNPPTPGQERPAEVRFGVGVPQPDQQAQEHSVGKQEAERCTQLRPHRRPGPPTRFGGLHRQQCRATPFAAECQALGEAQDRQHCRGQQTDLVVGGQQPDGEGRDTHGEQRAHQGGFAADAVTEVAEQH